MSTLQRPAIYLKVKSYMKHRKKELRFPFHPSLERSERLWDDLKFLKEYNYETLQPRQSEVLGERDGTEHPMSVGTVTPESFWDLLFSDEWCECDSLRVCEGVLLNKLMEELYRLSKRRTLTTYRLERFDTCDFKAPRSSMKTPECKAKYVAQPVKISFTIYFPIWSTWEPTSVSSSSITNNDYSSLVAEYDSPISSSVKTRSVVAGILSDSESEASDYGEFEVVMPCYKKSNEGHFYNCTSQSYCDASSPVMTESPTFFHSDRLRPEYQPQGIKTPSSVSSNLTARVKSSIEFQPSHESIEHSVIVFEDNRHCPDSDSDCMSGFNEADEEHYPRLSASGNKSVDYQAEKQNIQSQLRYGFRRGLARRWDAPVGVNISTSAPMVRGGESDSTSQVDAENFSTARVSLPSINSSLEKVHPNRAALAHQFKTDKKMRCINNKDKIVTINEELRLEAEEYERLNGIPVKLTDEDQSTDQLKKSMGKIVEITSQEPRKIDPKSLRLNYSIEKLRVWSLQRHAKKVNFSPTLENYRRKHVEAMLNPKLQAIYKKKGFFKSPVQHKIGLLTRNPRMESKMADVLNYLGPQVSPPSKPLFAKVDDAAFRRKLLEAVSEFAIQKEMVTCSRGRPTITTITFNRIIPKHDKRHE